MSLRRTGPGLQHHLPGANPENARPGAGIKPRYSGLRVQGTATSPSSTAKSIKWRRERDSNPRDRVLPHLLAFQASAFDQLSHLSTLDIKKPAINLINYTMKLIPVQLLATQFILRNIKIRDYNRQPTDHFPDPFSPAQLRDRLAKPCSSGYGNSNRSAG
jgi:hypothetical protein